MCRAELTRKIVRELIYSCGGSYAAAQTINVAPAHLYNVFTRANPSPTLEAALIEHGYLDPIPTRVRLAIDCSRDTRRRFRDGAAKRGMTGEAYLLYMMEVTR